MNVIAFEIQCPPYTTKRKQKEIFTHIKSNYIDIIISLLTRLMPSPVGINQARRGRRVGARPVMLVMVEVAGVVSWRWWW